MSRYERENERLLESECNSCYYEAIFLESKGNDRVCKAIQNQNVPKHFEGNLKLVFTSPRTPAAASSSTRTKNKNTTKRCEKLRSLDAISLVRWAVAYPRTMWAQSRIKNATFQMLLERNRSEPSRNSDVCRELVDLVSANIPNVCESVNFGTFVTGLISLPKCAQFTILTFLKSSKTHARQRQTRDSIT